MAELWREYRYRSLFHVSHDQFLDEPTTTVAWMVEMANIEAKVKRDLAK